MSCPRPSRRRRHLPIAAAERRPLRAAAGAGREQALHSRIIQEIVERRAAGTRKPVEIVERHRAVADEQVEIAERLIGRGRCVDAGERDLQHAIEAHFDRAGIGDRRLRLDTVPNARDEDGRAGPQHGRRRAGHDPDPMVGVELDPTWIVALSRKRKNAPAPVELFVLRPRPGCRCWRWRSTTGAARRW